MSTFAAFRRQPVPQQFAQNHKTITIPAPTRGIVLHENEAFLGPGACMVSDNWIPTMRGVKLRGGTIRHCDLHDVSTVPVWVKNTAYVAGDIRRDAQDNSLWSCETDHTSNPSIDLFAVARTASPGLWIAKAAIDTTRKPVISGFEYVSFTTERMFAAQDDKLFDVTGGLPVLVKGDQTSGNYSASQFANATGEWMLACNETGDPVLRFNGTGWVTLVPPAVPSDGATAITGPVGTPVEFGRNLSYVCKYRNRYYFIERRSMNVWYLPIDAVGGTLVKISLAGATTRGGYLMFLAVWSMDAGDGMDDKLIMMTNLGELLIYTGVDPAIAATWRQEGRYQLSPPLGMNAHIQIGGDLVILTVDGMIPLSQAIVKGPGELELAMISRAIKPMWRDEVSKKRGWAWTIKKWDEYGGIFITWPGSKPGYCAVMNGVTSAFGRCVGWDATCFLRMRTEMYFGTQDGTIMQAERTGFDDGNHTRKAYVCTLVGGWEMFRAPSQQVTWHQARAVFRAKVNEPFQPQLSAATDFLVTIPPPPPVGEDVGVLLDVWDQGKWGPAGSGNIVPVPPAHQVAYAQWDQPSAGPEVNRNTLWESIGMTGFSHAPIVQATIAQELKPSVELIAIGATYEYGGVTV